MMQQPPSQTTSARSFETKIKRSEYALFVERVWVRLWAVFAVLGLFLATSFAGVWSAIPFNAHIAGLVMFAAAGTAAGVFAARVRRPTRSEAITRMERDSNLPHRPASSYEDTLTSSDNDPTTAAIWQAHRSRLSTLLSKLRVRSPAPLTHRFDPLALRALGGLALILTAGLLGDRASDRLASAFHFGPRELATDARLDAWVTPPAYTAKPPIMLADGQRPSVSLARDDQRFEVPTGSQITIRATGTGGGDLTATFAPDASKVTQVSTGAPVAGAEGVAELRTVLKTSGKLQVAGQAKPWAFKVIPDLPPKIALTKEPEPNQRGAMKLSYKVEDDYGVVSAEVRFARVAKAAEDETTAWARTQILTGPRPPLERPPRYALRLPQPSTAAAASKPTDAMTYLELGAHPWAGLRVAMTLEARDAAGQVGRSETKELLLPARRFTKPLARALVEQRRKLVEDPRYRDYVAKSLAALMIEPDGVVDPRAYLGMKTVEVRLGHDRSRAAVRSAIEQLWQIALRIEDGTLSDAERRLKEAQDKLAKAIDEGASEAELDQLMKELRQAMNDYVEQLAKQNEGKPDPQGEQDADKNELGQNDLEQMMRKMEQAAKNGSREQAQQMLSEMRDLMDRLQAQKGEKADREQSRQMQKKMDELGNVIGQQQKLMDDTFSQMKREGDKGNNGKQQQGQKGAGKGKPGEKGQGQAQNKGDKGAGKGQQGQKGAGEQPSDGVTGEPGESADGTDANSSSGLSKRQKALAEQLDKLKDAMKQSGGGGSQEMEEANAAMEEAERALDQGALDEATDQQGDALDKMRQGAQKMQQEMAKNGRNRYGENGETPRDPLGRPQKSQGPDAGASVKVPGEIDMQRAREILQELRKRSAEQTRPPVELDYLERLLKRF